MTEGPLEVEVLGPDGAVLRPHGAGGVGRGVRVAMVALAVLVFTGTVAFAVSRLTASSAGAGSPEEAVDELLGAIERGDLIGVLELLRPAEQEALAEPLLELGDELRRLEVLDGDVDLSDVDGVSVDFDGVGYEVERIDDGLAVVTVAGTVASSVDLDALVDDGLLGGLLSGGAADDQASEATAISDVEIAVVEEGGEWYVSLWHTAAETARQRAGTPYPDEPAVDPVGADSPEQVLTGLVDAVTSFDPQAVIALVDPEEAAPIYEYSALFLPDLSADAAARRDELGVAISVSGLDATAERDGSIAVVSVDDWAGVSVEATWTDPVAGDSSITYRNGCLSVAPAGIETCGDDLGPGLLPSFGPTALVVVERDGRWYLSPGRTLADGAVDALGGLERTDLEEMIAAIGEMAVAGAQGVVDLPVPDDPAPPFEPVAADHARVEAITAGLPTGVDGVSGDGHFDDAYGQRIDGETRLTVSRVFQLHSGFADITVTEQGRAAPSVESAAVDRFGDGVVIVGMQGGHLVQVSVFGLDRGLDAEAAALGLFEATGRHLGGL